MSNNHDQRINYEKLFGPLNFKQGDNARSVYSPAAYLTDLLHLVDVETNPDSIDDLKKLGQRREDIIEKIKLDADNSYDLLPYLDIVNERLIAEVNKLVDNDVNNIDLKSKAFNLLKNNDYPNQLPFDYHNERVKLYLEYLSVSSEEIYKTYAGGFNSQGNYTIAKEQLGLSSNLNVLLTTPWVLLNKVNLTIPDIAEIIKESFGHKLSILKNLSINEDGNFSGMPGDKEIDVSELKSAMGLTHNQLECLVYGPLNIEEQANHILGQQVKLEDLYLNQGLGGWFKFNEQQDKLVWSQGIPTDLSVISWLDRAYRVIRLSHAISIDFNSLELILRTCCNCTLDHAALVTLSFIKTLNMRFAKPIDEVCTLFSSINNCGFGRDVQPSDLFNRTFNGLCALSDKSYIGEVRPEQYLGFDRITWQIGDILSLDNKNYRRRIVNELGISEKQLKTIVTGFRSRLNQHITDHNDYIELWYGPNEEFNLLNTLYRVTTLANCLELTIESLFTLFDVLENDAVINQMQYKYDCFRFASHTKNCFDIVRESELHAHTVSDRIWLIQALQGVAQYIRDNGFSAKELLTITCNKEPRKLVLTQAQLKDPTTYVNTNSKSEKDIAGFDRLYQKVKNKLLSAMAYVSNEIDERTARIVHEVNNDMSGTLVASSDNRIALFDEHAAKTASLKVTEQLDMIDQADFLGLGLEEKVAQKIFDNLVLMGYLNTDGALQLADFPQDKAHFHLQTNFSAFKQPLYDLITQHVVTNPDDGFHISDLDELGMLAQERNELYDNLIFNGYLDNDGNIIEKATFESIENFALFEINSQITAHADEVYSLISVRVKQFKQLKIKVSKGVFSELKLDESQLEDLLKNLHFNDYIDEQMHIVDNQAIIALSADNFLLEVQFYPYTQQIIAALQSLVAKQKQQFEEFSLSDFKDIADNLIADWVYAVFSQFYLTDGRLTTDALRFFSDDANAEQLDVHWPFKPSDNKTVFERIQSIITGLNDYRFTHASLESMQFEQVQYDQLVSDLTEQGYLQPSLEVHPDKVDFFLNANNALSFEVEGFLDFNKDLFFVLNELARNTHSLQSAIIEKHQSIAEQQQRLVYRTLAQTLSLKEMTVMQLSKQLFNNSQHIENWLAPIISTVGLDDTLSVMPADSLFSSTWKRIKQFSLFAAKMGLNEDEVAIAFRDQSLVEKFPVNLALPEVMLRSGHTKRIDTIDALLESTDGYIYVFLSKNDEHQDSYARYWQYDASTLERVETDDDKLASLLTGNTQSGLVFDHVVAAYVDKMGRNVVIADNEYYVMTPKLEKDDSNHGLMAKPWQKLTRKWGQTDMEYEDFSQVDAIYTDTTGAIFMFSGGQYVKFSDPQNIKKPDLGYPKVIAQSWSEEGQSEALHKTFDCHIDASFQGLDDKTYFFKDDYFVTSDAPQTRRAISDVWGKVRNRLAEGHRVDACFVGKNPLLVNDLASEGSEESGENGTDPFMQNVVTVFSGDQVFAYQDCIENPELEIVSGYPLEITDYLLACMGLNSTDGYRFETNMLAFLEGIDAAFVGHDGKLNLFKGEYTVVLGDMPAQLVVSKTKDIWPNNTQTIANSGADGEFFNVSAALTGLDGRVYLFVDNLYYRFSGTDLSVVDAGFPKPIADDWHGLETIDAAFVMDGKTYLFGQIDDHKQYIRYVTNDYRTPDEGYPKAQQETASHWWNLPDSWTGDDVDAQKQFKGVDAVFNAPDKKTYLFSGRYFTYFDHVNRWWAEPELIADKWPALPDAFHYKIDAAFSDKTGKTYLFSAGQYVRFSDAHYCEIDAHYPKSTSLGFAQNALEQGMTPCADFIVTAAMSLIAQEKEVDVNDNEIIHTRLYSYLFSGDRYYRYRSEFNDSRVAESSQWLTTLDADYPKPITKLKDEPRFKHFNETSSVLLEQDVHWLARLDAAFADMRNVYLFIDNRIEVVSTQNDSQYDRQMQPHLDASHSRLVNAQYALNLNKIDGVQCVLMENGHIYMCDGSDWAQFTSLEGYQLGINDSAPTLIELLHEEDQTALTTVLEGADGNTYYFKSAEQGEHAYYYDKQLDKGERVADKWAKVANNIEKHNHIDSVIHYDNKTYVFSGGQYVIYDEQVDPFLTPNTPVWTDNTELGIRSVSDDFGLHRVDIAYTADGITYLLEHPDEAGNRRYAMLEHCDGEGMYKTKVDYLNNHDWQMPEYLEDHGWLMPDAILNKSQLQKTTMQSDGFRRRNNRSECHQKEVLVFIKGREYVNYDPNTAHWTKPASIADLWGDILECEEQVFDHLQGVYIHPRSVIVPDGDAMDGIYFLGKHCFQSLLYDLDQQGVSLTAQREYKDYLGVVKSVFTNIDATFVYQSRYTYLFSGNRYIRYTGDDYCHMDEGYPKFIETELNKEPGFTKLPDSFATTISHIVKQYTSNENAEQMPSCHGEPAIISHTIINGIISNGHSTYLFLNHGNNEPDSCFVFSEHSRRTVTLDMLAHLPNLFDRTESIDAAVTYQGATYLFSKDKYLRYSNCDYEHPDKGYPKSIAQSLLTDIGKGGQLHADFHCDIDGATVGRDGHLYLFKGKQYVELTMPSIAKVIASDWKIDTESLTNPLCQSSMGELEGGLSQSVFDGAFVDDLGRLYIIKGDQVLRYADTEQLYFEPGFPQHVSEVFKQLPQEFQQGVNGAFTFAGHTYLVQNGANIGEGPSLNGNFVRYPTGQYHCLYTPHKDLLYPQTFASRWGRWADYRLQDLALISSFKKLNEKASDEHDLTAMFKHHGGYVDKPFEKIAAMYDWDLEDLTWLKRKNGFLPNQGDYEQFVTLEWLDRVNQIFALAHRLRTSAKSVYQDIYMPRYMAQDKVDGELFEVDGVKYHFDRNQAIADKLLTYLTGKHCKDAQAKILKSEIHNRLNILKRDAMVPFILHKDDEIFDERDLSEKLLIDVQMSECMETSRVKEAIGAVQLYFHRLFLNLEQVELKGESHNEHVRKALKERWEWFKNYRVWEANRKVFLYPENYIRPELRDTKTELFTRFEEAISQGNLNNDTLNKAFGQYVDSYAQVSNLTIAGGYVYDNPNNSADKEVILFAHTKTQPMTYYYRTATFVEGQTSEVVWRPWQSVNIAIDAERVYPVFIQNKIFVFWTRVEQVQVGAQNSKVEIRANNESNTSYTQKTNSATQSVIKFFYSTLNSNQQWSTPQQLNYQKAFKEKVSAHYLSFQHQESKTSGGLDKIEIQCFSSLENEILPVLEDDQTVDLKKLRDEVVRVNRLAHFEHNHPTLYFKAVSEEGDYYLYAAPAQEESDKSRLKMKRVIPGDKLPAIYLQGMLPFGTDGKDTQKNGFYIIRDYQQSPYYFYMAVQGSEAWSIKGNVHQHIERDITPQIHRTMMLRKASTGNGFNLVYQANGSDAEHTLYYEHNLEVSAFESKDSSGQIKSPQNEQLSHSAFIPVTHYENHTRFEFTPQTNQSVELSNKAADKDFNWINSGIGTFEKLFPKEDSSRIQQPVALNVPDNSGQNLSWLCFDYKGGSFLCKPTIGNIEVEEANDLGSWFNSSVAQQAVYNTAADKTYWFGGNTGQGQFVRLSDEELVSNAAPSSAKQISEYWGRVRQDIRTNIDAALYAPNAVSGKGAVYLFSDKDYIRFTLNEGQEHDLLQADTGYPKILGQDKDVIHLPKEQVSGAFHNGGNNYFVQGKLWGTVDSNGNMAAMPYPLWPQAKMTDALFDVSKITGVFEYDSTIYLVYDYRDIKEYGPVTQKTQLVNRLKSFHNTTDNGGLVSPNDMSKGFTYAGHVFYQVEVINDGGNEVRRFHQETNALYFTDELGGSRFKLYSQTTNYKLDKLGTSRSSIVREASSHSASTAITSAFYYNNGFYVLQNDGYIRRTDFVMQALINLITDDVQNSDQYSPYLDSLEHFIYGAQIDSAYNVDDKIVVTAGNRRVFYANFNDISALKGFGPISITTDHSSDYTGFKAAFDCSKVKGGGRFYEDEGYRVPDNINTVQPYNTNWSPARNELKANDGQIDAVFAKNNVIYLLTGDHYYRYSNLSELDDLLQKPLTSLSDTDVAADAGYPKRIAQNQDGVYQLSGNREVDLQFAFASDDDTVYVSGRGSAKLFNRVNSLGQVVHGKPMILHQSIKDALGVTHLGQIKLMYNHGSHTRVVANGKYLDLSNLAGLLPDLSGAKYDILRLSSMTGSEIARKFYSGGVEGLLELPTQLMDETPRFMLDDEDGSVATDDTRIVVNAEAVDNDNVPSDSHLEFRHANGIYYWELFYHLSALVAQTLSESQKFEAAKHWYQTIFDPSSASDNWHFLPFVSSDIDAIVAKLAQLKEVTELTATTNTFINALEPLNPLFKGQRLTPEQLDAIKQGHATFSAGVNANITTALIPFELALTSFNAGDNEVVDHVKQEILPLVRKLPARIASMQTQAAQIRAYLEDPFDPHTIAGLRTIAYRRNIVMGYVDNLIDWADALFRRYTRESINEARMLYMLAYDMLGKRPDNLGDLVLSDSSNYSGLQTLGADTDERTRYDVLFDVDGGVIEHSLNFAGRVHESVTNSYFHVPENQHLLKYWDRVEDRLHKIRQCLDINGIKQPLPLFQPPIDPMALVNAVAGGGGVASAIAGLSAAVPYYRFDFMLAKAKELVAQVSQFDGELLGTIEKLEAEQLSQLQQKHEGVILDKSRAAIEARLEEANLSKQGLEENLARANYQKTEYDSWLTHTPGVSVGEFIDDEKGWLASEVKQLESFDEAGDMLYLSVGLEGAASALEAIGELKLGSPFSMGTTLHLGKIAAAVASVGAKIAQTRSEILSYNAESYAVVAQHELSMRDWQMQRTTTEHEENELKLQIQGADENIKSIENELLVHDQEVKHNAQVAYFLQSKFTNAALYAWMKGRLMKAHDRAFKLAHDYAKASEVAYRFERGITNAERDHIQGMHRYWDSSKLGHQSANQLSVDLHELEKAHLDTHQRDHEVTKTISLAQWDPIALMTLKHKRLCQFKLTEEMFAYDFPSHYCRQIKAVKVQIEAGDGTTVNAILTQQSHKTVMEPDVNAVKHLLSPEGTAPLSIRSNWRPNQHVAVSQLDQYTQQSSGVFELNFADSRYLPFEGTGAVSNWQLEIPGAQSNFDINQIKDVKIELDYTAKNGGNEYANQVRALLKPYTKAVYLDIAQLFANDFYDLVHQQSEELTLNLSKVRLPGMHGDKIDAIYTYMETENDEQVNLTLNGDDAMILRNKGILLTNSVRVGQDGARWTLTPQGDVSKLEKLGLIVVYKAKV